MNGITLKQITRAIKTLRKKHGNDRRFTDLVDAQGYLMGMIPVAPPDPREFLTAIGYNWNTGA